MIQYRYKIELLMKPLNFQAGIMRKLSTAKDIWETVLKK